MAILTGRSGRLGSRSASPGRHGRAVSQAGPLKKTVGSRDMASRIGKLPGSVKPILVAANGRLTDHVVRRFGAQLGLIPIIEFPKSGGTWLARMVGTTTGVPFIEGHVMPPSGPAIVRYHWTPRGSHAPGVYVVRDPRDVMVSLYHHRLRHWNSSGHFEARWFAEFGRRLPEAVESMDWTTYIMCEHRWARKRGSGTTLPWGEHVRSYLDIRTALRPTLCRYEDLRGDPVGALRDVLLGMSMTSPDASFLADVVGLYDSGRADDHRVVRGKSFYRTGASGGWRSVLPPAADDLVCELYGREMKAMGYS